MEPPEITNLSCFRTEQRQQAAPGGGKIYALCTCSTSPGRRSPPSLVVSVLYVRVTGGHFNAGRQCERYKLFFWTQDCDEFLDCMINTWECRKVMPLFA